MRRRRFPYLRDGGHSLRTGTIVPDGRQAEIKSGNTVNKPKPETSATVIFAVYDEAPIACQGDDDRKKIRVVTDRLTGNDIRGDALRLSVALSAAHGSHVQVWDIRNDAPGDD